MKNVITLPDELLERQWNAINFDRVKKELFELQGKIYEAARLGIQTKVRKYQDELVENIDYRCYAVEKVAKAPKCKKVDRRMWKTGAEKMRVALSLKKEGYEANPLTCDIFEFRSHEKFRYACVPPKFDRAMITLYAFALMPAVEARADKNSFAFRKEKSYHDAHTYLYNMLTSKDAPRFVVTIDIKSYFHDISHTWLRRYLPMDKDILNEFLKTNIIATSDMFEGFKIIESADQGISLGSALSPYIGNYVLDGLQGYVYNRLYPDHNRDYPNGFMVRYADDIVFTARSEKEGEKILDIVYDFIFDRGLTFNTEKTGVHWVYDGFDFLSYHYEANKYGTITVEPEKKKVDAFIADTVAFIQCSLNMSYMELITKLNQKLQGWANYYKYSEAYDDFLRVDEAITTALINYVSERHKRGMSMEKLKDRFFFTLPTGETYFTLPRNRSVRVIRVSEIPLVTHSPVDTSRDIFSNDEYFNYRNRHKQIVNITGEYKTIWKKQKGKCHYCGRPILVDEDKAIRYVHPANNISFIEPVYVHECCANAEYNLVRLNESLDYLYPYDVFEELDKIDAKVNPDKREKSVTKPIIRESWKYYKLKQHFATMTSQHITMTFDDIIKLSGVGSLPDGAYKVKQNRFWYALDHSLTICDAWESEGYTMYKKDVANEKIYLKRIDSNLVKFHLPKEFEDNVISKDTSLEITEFLNNIIKRDKIGKKKRRKAR